jgi:hypothetical protein
VPDGSCHDDNVDDTTAEPEVAETQKKYGEKEDNKQPLQ